jgi:hypothetical protein
LLDGAGLEAAVTTVAVDVPWPGAAEFPDYRLSMMGPDADRVDRGVLRREAIAAIESLAPEALPWRPALILGLGTR